MAKPTRFFFATDVHGSEACFRKFLNGGRAYKPDAMILGGDIAGKAIQAIVDRGGGRYRFTFRGKEYDLEDGEELVRIERLISDNGYYPYRCGPDELSARAADGTIEQLLTQLMRERLEGWMQLADERLRPLEVPVLWMLGNDDPPELAEVLDAAPWGTHAEGKVVELAGFQVASYGYANPTPWDSYRELPEEELGEVYDGMAAQISDFDRAVFNFHVPPVASGLDEAPVLDDDLTVQTSAGQVKMGAVGSTAVRAAIERYQPLAGLHGHVHESAGFCRIGRTLAVNPGSDYGTGALNGAILGLQPGKVKAHQFVRG